jgi:hypothetical protein
MLLALPASALAAPPANDSFANRQVLSGPLPIEQSGSNFEATKEAEEPLFGMASAGHSVWFEWEAENDGWVTIGACDDEFPTVLAVFTGNAVKTLTLAVDGNGSEGPDCPYTHRQFSFEASAGTKYEIAVDGNGFGFPDGPPPVTEGAIKLTIEQTPVPSNDDFADATLVQGQISEEPGGARRFFAHVAGFTWTATAEGEEPEAASTGASVWYSLTAPEEADYSFGAPCCGTASALRRDIYDGNAVDQLRPIAVGAGSPVLHLFAGQTVRIRVAGPIDPGTGEPKVANFDFNVSADLAPRKPVIDVFPPPPVAPETTIARSVFSQQSRQAKFLFSSTVEGSSFQCKLDKGDFKPCASPRSYKHLKPGRHAFRVRAVAPSGLADASAALGRFAIAKPQRRR